MGASLGGRHASPTQRGTAMRPRTSTRCVAWLTLTLLCLWTPKVHTAGSNVRPLIPSRARITSSNPKPWRHREDHGERRVWVPDFLPSPRRALRVSSPETDHPHTSTQTGTRTSAAVRGDGQGGAQGAPTPTFSRSLIDSQPAEGNVSLPPWKRGSPRTLLGASLFFAPRVTRTRHNLFRNTFVSRAYQPR